MKKTTATKLQKIAWVQALVVGVWVEASFVYEQVNCFLNWAKSIWPA